MSGQTGGAWPSQRAAETLAGIGAAIIAGASDAIVAMDRDGAIVVWNAGCEQLFGWTAAEMLGRSAEVLVPQERRDELTRVLRALAGSAEPAAVETERLHKSGAVLPVSCRISPVRDRSGQVTGACAVLRDNGREIDLRRQLQDARQVSQARFEQSVVAQASLSPDGVIVEVNAALCQLSGREPTRLLGRPLGEFLAGEHVEALEVDLARLAAGEATDSRRPQLVRHEQGHCLETQLSLFALHDPSGAVQRLEVIVEDVSVAATIERESELREARWRSLVLHSSDVAMLCDADATPLFVSPSVTSVFGYSAAELVGADGWGFIHPDDVDVARATWAATAQAPLGTTETFELRVRHADGSWRWVEESLTNQLDAPQIAAMVVNLIDISDRKAAEAVLDELTGIDSLTGLATRAPLMAALDAAFAGDRAASTAVMIFDLTRFKLVNDTYGHRTGDEVLAELAFRLHTQVADAGVVARVGGDRFAVMLHDVADIDQVHHDAAAMLGAVQAPVVVQEHSLTLTATVGAALGPAPDSGALLASAESALLVAKQGLTGPMHVVRAESDSTAMFRARLIEDLRRGLQADELVVHFQPVMSLTDDQPVAAEALVRWAHPDKGLLEPAAFIDAAEDSGLIVDVGEKVLREACRAAASWAQLDGLRHPFHVAVNLSARQLTDHGLVAVVQQALADSGATAEHLMLEVTESAVMSDLDAAARTLQELRELGVGIAVDDFGTGYSSLTYLKRFPVTALKIDRSFVAGLGGSADDAAIVTSVITLAKAMQLDCVAEGIETEPQRLVLQALGCPHGQGFLWSAALDVADMLTWLAASVHDQPVGHRPTPARLRARRRIMMDAAVVRTSPPDPLVLARIDELIAEGASPATIAAALNADLYLTAMGKRWSPRAIEQLLASRAPH